VSRKYAKVFWVLSIDTVVIEMIQLPLQIMFIGKIYRLSDVCKEKKKNQTKVIKIAHHNKWFKRFPQIQLTMQLLMSLICCCLLQTAESLLSFANKPDLLWGLNNLNYNLWRFYQPPTSKMAVMHLFFFVNESQTDFFLDIFISFTMMLVFNLSALILVNSIHLRIIVYTCVLFLHMRLPSHLPKGVLEFESTFYIPPQEVEGTNSWQWAEGL